MGDFWDYNVWGFLNLVAVLLASLLFANFLRRSFKPIRDSLIPVSVLGGAVLLLIATVYNSVTGREMFDERFFGGNGSSVLELITYHTLAMGFIATAFKTSDAKLTKKRMGEIFNTGVTTVSSYLIQGVAGLLISLAAATLMKDFFSAAGVLLPFGYGQGTGQALNYGNIYETDYGFVGGKSFGLTIAALGFLSAAIGGVIHLNILRKKGLIAPAAREERALRSEQVQSDNEIPMQDSIDKLTVQMGFVLLAYLLAYILMMLLGNVLPGMRSVIYGFNFLLGVLSATLIKGIVGLLKKKGIVKKEHINNFLMTRVSNFLFDIMVVAGIAAIRISVLSRYWGVIAVLAIVGAVLTYFYERFVADTLFPEYSKEQFLMMYGMLTGTASTGIILLREVDPEFETPVADNMVYQNFPAIVFGFPMMLLAVLAPQKPWLTLIILAAFFAVMNVILFRSKIFKTKSKRT